MAQISALVFFLAIGCSKEKTEEPVEEKEPPESFAGYEQVELNEADISNLFYSVSSVLGHPYIWGADSKTNGFDCSGLIQWAYRELGVNRFKNEDAVYHEIASHELYLYNTQPIADINSTRRGDFVFFDVNGDGRITHNAILDRIDEDGGVWVYDSYSVGGGVMHRQVQDFWKKGPRFGRPLKTVPRAVSGEKSGQS